MNRKIATAALVAIAFAGNALAESPTVLKDDFVSTKTRDAVQAELVAYKKAGVNPWSTQYNPLRTFQSVKTRDAVIADYIASRDAVAAFTAEDSGSAWLANAYPAPVSDTLAAR